jgi:plastocyanin
MRGHRFVVVGLGALLALATVACSSENNTTVVQQPTGGTSSSEPAGVKGQLTIVDFAFQPSAVLAGAGGSLTITNEGSTTHTFTMDDDSIDEELEPGATVEVTIGEAGGFHCEIHPQMTGTIVTE